jgi:hypothetical protein
MKTKSFAVLLCAVVLSLVLKVSAVTFDELAGTYIGKRTEAYVGEPGVLRYDEIVIITAEGVVTSYIEFNGGFLLASTGRLELNEDGTFGDELSMGELTLHGRHLAVEVQYFPPFFPDVVVRFQGRRSTTRFEPPFNSASEQEAVSGFPLWAPVD